MLVITSRRNRRLAAAGAVAVAGALALAACSSSSSSSPAAAGSPAGSSSPTATGAAGVAYAQAQVARYSGVTDAFPAPGPSIDGIAKVKGGTITYIPLFLLAPYFEAVAGQLSAAAAAAGMTVKVCNGSQTPTGVASCFSQAIDGKSAGIITDAVPYSYANNPYAAAAKAHVPVVALDITDQPPATLDGETVTLPQDTELSGRLVADSIIADSKGKANALLVVSTYNAQSTQNKDAMEDEFSRYCPGCHVTQVIVNENDQIPGVSLALTKDPSIDYVVAQEDQPVGPIVQGALKQLNKHIVTVSEGGALNGMQAVQAGTNLADVGNDPASAAWNATDLLVRMATGSPVPALDKYTTVIRVFDKSNIGSLSLTNGAFNSGAWYTGGQFRGMYTSLWKAS